MFDINVCANKFVSTKNNAGFSDFKLTSVPNE